MTPLLSSAALLLLCAGAAADTRLGVFPSQRVVAADGRTYVVLWWRMDEGQRRLHFEIARAAPGSPALGSVVTDERTRDRPLAAIEVRAGDEILGRGILLEAPQRVLLPTDGGAVFLIDEDEHAGKGDVLRVLDLDGSLRFARTMQDLHFTLREKRDFATFSGDTSWLRSAWYDETTHEVVFLCLGNTVRSIGIVTGNVRSEWEAILRALQHRDAPARDAAWRAAADLRLVAARPLAASTLANATLSVSQRLSSAVVLAQAGDDSGLDLVRDVALWPETESEADRCYAIAHLPDVLGAEALPALLWLFDTKRYPTPPARKPIVLPRTDWLVSAAAMHGLAKLDAGRDVVTDVVSSDPTPAIRIAAIEALGACRHRDALSVLEGAAGEADDDVRRSALEAIDRVGGRRAVGMITSLIRKRMKETGRVTEWEHMLLIEYLCCR